MDTEIDLGVNDKERYGGMGMGMSAPPMGEGKDKQYPCFHYCGPEELDLPESGTMEIKFTKRSETSSVRPDGKHWYECAIEVQCICDVEGEDDEGETGEGPGTEAEKALDTLARALGKEQNG